MTTVDTNILLYASDSDGPHQQVCVDLLRRLATGPELVTFFWPVLLGFVRLSTHPAIFRNPLSLEAAVAAVERMTAASHVRVLGEADGFWQRFAEVAGPAKTRGPLVTDAHLATLMRQHGVREIWTNDRDFRKFDGIVVRDPFAAA
ncbi:MAG: TA system VapC family ribonuclease toxin [Micromonosporaceae bacterium]